MKRKLTVLLVLVIMALSTTVCFAEVDFFIPDVHDEEKVAQINQESAIMVAETNQRTVVMAAGILGGCFILGSYFLYKKAQLNKDKEDKNKESQE